MTVFCLQLDATMKGPPLEGVVVFVCSKHKSIAEELNTIVVNLGGDYLWNLNDNVTHVIFQQLQVSSSYIQADPDLSPIYMFFINFSPLRASFIPNLRGYFCVFPLKARDKK